MKAELILEEDCSYSTYGPRILECEAGVIVDYTGTGKWTRVETDEKCPSCKGKGRRLTHEGRQMLEFVRRWADVEELE